jgi:FKBP-type peptidyl-prolyl cis-trans isomerase
VWQQLSLASPTALTQARKARDRLKEKAKKAARRRETEELTEAATQAAAREAAAREVAAREAEAREAAAREAAAREAAAREAAAREAAAREAAAREAASATPHIRLGGRGGRGGRGAGRNPSRMTEPAVAFMGAASEGAAVFSPGEAQQPPAAVSLANTTLDTGRPGVPESTLGGETTCIVCFVNPKTHLAVPCGHISACEQCSTAMESCPYCRAPASMWIHARVV